MMPFGFMMIMLSFKSLSDKYSREVGENKCLYEGHQDLNEVDKDSKQNRYRRESPAGYLAHFAKYEDEGDETQNDNVPRHHIGKQTNDQCSGFDNQHTGQFNRNQNQFNRKRYSGRP